VQNAPGPFCLLSMALRGRFLRLSSPALVVPPSFTNLWRASLGGFFGLPIMQGRWERSEKGSTQSRSFRILTNLNLAARQEACPTPHRYPERRYVSVTDQACQSDVIDLPSRRLRLERRRQR
jgi:hypothetical protein